MFSGDPDWQKLLQTPPAALSEEEQAFLDGPVEHLCSLLDELQIKPSRGDCPLRPDHRRLRRDPPAIQYSDRKIRKDPGR